MTDALREAAQAVLKRWDSPQWEWKKHGPTADLMAALRAALAAPPAVPPGMAPEWINAVMDQAQVFASAWSLVGGRFDFGRGLEEAEIAKQELRAMLAAAQPESARPVPDTGAVPDAEVLAHRIAWRYKKSSDPNHSDTYTFNRFTLLQFADALRAAHTGSAAE